MIRGTGHKPDKPFVHDYPTGSTPTGSFLDLSGGCIVRDQGSTSSCVGQALAAAAEIAIGHKARFSAIAAYTIARMLERDRWQDQLTDQGSYPLLATLGLQRHGFVAKNWDDVNSELPLDLLENGVTHKLTQYYRIPGPGSFEGIRRSLAAGNAVTLAVTVDQSFDGTDGHWPVPAPSGPSRGSHYVCAVGYGPDGIKILNSWSSGWGAAGYAWLSPERVEHETTKDRQVIDVVEI